MGTWEICPICTGMSACVFCICTGMSTGTICSCTRMLALLPLCSSCLEGLSSLEKPSSNDRVYDRYKLNIRKKPCVIVVSLHLNGSGVDYILNYCCLNGWSRIMWCLLFVDDFLNSTHLGNSSLHPSSTALSSNFDGSRIFKEEGTWIRSCMLSELLHFGVKV